VIDVHMGDHQRADVFDGKIDGQIVCRGPATRLLTLEQPAVDENAVLAPMTGFDAQFMAGAGNAGDGAVVLDFDHVQCWGFLVISVWACP